MPQSQITIKHNKHRIHPCPKEKKLSLLTLLLSQNSDSTIIVALKNSDILKEFEHQKNVTIISDEALLNSDASCKLLISYDLPLEASTYIQRVSKATEGAIILLDIEEQKELYPIETILKRAIKQESVAGFEYEVKKETVKEKKPFHKTTTDQKPKKEYKKTAFDNSKKEHKDKDKFYDKTKKEKKVKSFEKPKQWDKKDKKTSTYLGKDENGKAIFSAKSKDRNHKYDGSPKPKEEKSIKTIKKIPIKARKEPKKEPSDS
ncbi:MAG: hypothetical protein QG559_272 [Campylobacterota bacterium]|nr:hypothetical protein [Campylobacterota bacterium]